MRDIRKNIFFSALGKHEFEELLFNKEPLSYKANAPLDTNTWTYDNTIKGAHLKKDAGKDGWLRKIYELKTGDIIRISAEFYNISGEKAKIEVDGAEIQSTKSMEWETVTLKSVVKTDGRKIIYVGLWRADVGEFMMRNIKCEVLTQRSEISSDIESGSNSYGEYIMFSDGTMICRGEISKTTKLDNEWGCLYYNRLGRVRFPKPFSDYPDVCPTNKGARAFIPMLTGGMSKVETQIIDIYKPVKDIEELTYVVGYTAIGKWK